MGKLFHIAQGALDEKATLTGVTEWRADIADSPYLSDMSQEPCDEFYRPSLAHCGRLAVALQPRGCYPWSPPCLLGFTQRELTVLLAGCGSAERDWQQCGPRAGAAKGAAEAYHSGQVEIRAECAWGPHHALVKLLFKVQMDCDS